MAHIVVFLFYRIDVERMYHLNKQLQKLPGYFTTNIREDEELLDWRTLEGVEPPQLPGLTTAQKNDILRLLAEFPTVTGGKLGRTTVVEHKVHVEGGQPIHQQPTRWQWREEMF